jgi:Flp pilus assembly protein TadD
MQTQTRDTVRPDGDAARLAGDPARLAGDPARLAGDPARLDGEDRRRAAVLCDLRRWADAAAASGEMITADPRSPAAWCVMSRAQLGLGRARAALQAARTASSLDPSAEEPHRFVSLALGELGLEVEAAEAAAEATRCAPHSWQAHARLACSLAVLRNRIPDARRAAEQARALSPAEPGPHLAVGMVALAAGRRHDATSAFCAALGTDPQCFEAHNQLALLAAAGQGRRAPWLRLSPLRLRRAGRS